MSSVTFFCHPRELADALDNAVIIGNGTGRALKDNKDSCPHVYIAYQDSGDGANGVVAVYGAGRWTMGRTIIPLEGQVPDEPAVTSISVQNAKALQSTLRAAPCAADASAAVTIYDSPVEVPVGEPDDEDFDVIWVDVVFSKNGETLAELGLSDENGQWPQIMDFIDDGLESLGEPHEGPMALTLDGVRRLGELHATSKVVDFSRTGREGILAWRAGTFAMGVIGEINRGHFIARGGGTESDLVASGGNPI